MYIILGANDAMSATSRCRFGAPQRRAVFGLAFWTDNDVPQLWGTSFSVHIQSLKVAPKSGPAPAALLVGGPNMRAAFGLCFGVPKMASLFGPHGYRAHLPVQGQARLCRVVYRFALVSRATPSRIGPWRTRAWITTSRPTQVSFERLPVTQFMEWFRGVLASGLRIICVGLWALLGFLVYGVVFRWASCFPGLSCEFQRALGRARPPRVSVYVLLIPRLMIFLMFAGGGLWACTLLILRTCR